MIRLSYWITPIIAGLVWLATLLGLLLYWIVNEDRVHYPSMSPQQHIAYISDIGASDLKPLFIAGCVLTTVLLDTSFLADRWLRHTGRLAPNTTRGEKVLFGLTIVFAVVGTVGLILLSIFDTARHSQLHNIFLFLFIAGYILSAIFICWEYQLLRRTHREQRVLRLSFRIKLFFIIVEIALAIAFAACSWTKSYNVAAVLEWVIAFIFSFYVFSFYVDLYPAAKTKGQLEISTAGPGHGPKMRLTRGRGAPMGNGYDVSSEMEEGTSDRTTMSDAPASYEAARVAHGRRSGSRSRVMASNF